MLAVCEVSAKRGRSHFFFGGNEGVPELLRHKLQQKFPGLQVVGTYSPPFRSLTPEEDAAIMHNSALINLNVLEQLSHKGVGKVFCSLSACVYPEYNQLDPSKPMTAED